MRPVSPGWGSRPRPLDCGRGAAFTASEVRVDTVLGLVTWVLMASFCPDGGSWLKARSVPVKASSYLPVPNGDQEEADGAGHGCGSRPRVDWYLPGSELCPCRERRECRTWGRPAAAASPESPHGTSDGPGKPRAPGGTGLGVSVWNAGVRRAPRRGARGRHAALESQRAWGRGRGAGPGTGAEPQLQADACDPAAGCSDRPDFRQTLGVYKCWELVC